MNNQLNTSDIISYLIEQHIRYQFTPSFEHKNIGRIERNNRTAQDKLSCALAILSEKILWLYTLSDAVSKLNIIPRKHLAWQPSYFKWYGYQYDFLISHSYLLAVG